MSIHQMLQRIMLVGLSLLPLAGGSAYAADDTPEQVLARADNLLFPDNVTFDWEMVAKRADGTEKIYRVTTYKRGRLDARSEFTFPAVEKGRIMLRKGDQMWMAMPTTKKPIKLSPRQSLMGGDFDNTDVMRLNLQDDYHARFTDGTDAKTWVMELRTKDRSQSYDKIVFYVDRATFMPLKQELYTLSGKKIKELLYSEPQSFRGHQRPAVLRMHNLLTGKSSTTMRILDLQADKTLPANKFTVDSITQ